MALISRVADAAVAWGDDRGSQAGLVLVSREAQSVEQWSWLLQPGSSYEAKPDPEGTDVLVMVTHGTLAMTVEGEASQLTAGTAGHITSGASYVLANPGRADTAFSCTAALHPARPVQQAPGRRTNPEI